MLTINGPLLDQVLWCVTTFNSNIQHQGLQWKLLQTANYRQLTKQLSHVWSSQHGFLTASRYDLPDLGTIYLYDLSWSFVLSTGGNK